MKPKYQSIQKWFPIKTYQNNHITLKNGKDVQIFSVEPMNFSLKSSQEQEKILKQYQNCLKACDIDMEIVIQTDRLNIEKHFDYILQFSKEEPELSEMAENYLEFIRFIVKQRESVTRKFYLIIDGKVKHIEDTIKTHFAEMGNIITPCTENEVQLILKRCFKRDSFIRKETKWV